MGRATEETPPEKDLLSQPCCWLTFSHLTTNSVNCGRASHTKERQGTAALFASQKRGCLQWFQTQPSSSRSSPCSARTEWKSSMGKAKSVSLSTTHGLMKGTYTLLILLAPLIWNFICFCVDHSGYQGNYSGHSHSCLHSPISQHRLGTQGTVWGYSDQETTHPDAAFVVTRDFNKANFRKNSSKILPTHHHQHAWRSCTQPLLRSLPRCLQIPPSPTFQKIRSLFSSAPACL